MPKAGTIRPPFLSAPLPYPGLVRVYPLYGLDKTRLGPALATGAPSFGNSPGVRGFDYGGLAWDNSGGNSSINTQDKIETLTGGSAGSVSLWFRPTRAFNNGSDEFLLGQAGGSTNSFEIRRYGPFGQYFCGFYNGSDMRAQPVVTAANWIQNTWQHLCVTWINGGTAIVYQNGVDLGSHGATLTDGSPAGNLAISGSDPTDSATTFAGSITDVRVFNRALSPIEVADLYNPQTRFSIYPGSFFRKLFAPPAVGIAFDTAGNSGDQASASTYSGSATWNGTNRMLAVDVSMLGPGVTVTSMTYGGANCTFIGSKSTVTSLGSVESWRICSSDAGAPAAGANTLVVNLSGTIEFTAEWVSYTGVHQTSPTEGFNSAQATNTGSATDASVVITTASDNCWIHAAVVANDTSITAGQTSRNNISGTLGSGANEDNNVAVTPAGNTTMSFTGMGITTTWAIAGYAIRPITDPALVTAINKFLMLMGLGT